MACGVDAGSNGELITVAVDLSDVQSTVRALIWLQLAIGAAVLAGLGVAGYWVVSPQPAATGGDRGDRGGHRRRTLESRVPQGDPGTEVGQLALALNGMLAQISACAVASSDAAAEKARTSEDRMRRFITDASHELRTPLTTIRGFAELYRQGAAGDVEMLMSRIEAESRRMGVLVEDLLLLAQPRRAAAAGAQPRRSAGAGQRRRARRPVHRAGSPDHPGSPRRSGQPPR